MHPAHVLPSYGTGRMGRLGCERLSNTLQSMTSRLQRHESAPSRAPALSMETKARLHAFERYKDPAAGCDHYFHFYKRIVPLANIHARPAFVNEYPEDAVEKLAHVVHTNASFSCLGCITVCDDSIVPPNGPGTKIRSHLLEPTFTIVDGHLRIDAAKLAKESAQSIPDAVIIEVAVPDANASPAETEKQLLQLAIRLNRRAGMNPIADNAVHRDLRRIDCIRKFLKSSPEFESITASSPGRGGVKRAAVKAFESRAVPGDNVGPVHLERYVRVALLFNSCPEAYDIYKRETRKCKPGSNHISIVTLNSGSILKSEPAVSSLILECVCVHGNTQKLQINKRNHATFMRNIITIYENLRKTAQRFGFSKETFLDVDISFKSGSKELQRSTLREAIVAAASSKAMCTSTPKVKKIATTLQTSLKVAIKERQTQGPPPQGSTAPLSLSTTKKTFCKNGTYSRKDGKRQLQGEETASLSLAHAHQEINGPSEDGTADSPNAPSDEAETELRQKHRAFRARAMKSTMCGQKRAGSPERLSILRRKLLKRDGQRLGLEVSNGDVGSRASQLDVYGQIGDNEDVHRKSSVSRSEENTTTVPFPNSASSVRQPSCRFSRLDAQRLRTELRVNSSAAYVAPNGTLSELIEEEGTESIRRCTQFVSFWSNHRAAVDEKGYTQIELPSPTLTAAVKNMLRSTSRTSQKELEESCVVRKAEGETFGRDLEKRLHFANVFERHQQRAEGDEYNIPQVKFGWTRMMVDTALLLVSQWLGLYNSGDSNLGQESFLSNMELLSTPEQRDSRKPRLAFGPRRDSYDKEPWHPKRNPSYMFIVSGDVGFPMWIWERTHVLLRSPDELLPLIAKSIKPKRVFVKPRSVLLCRGDVVHAFENTYEIDEQEYSNPIAVLCHLVQCGTDRQKVDEKEGWWTKYIASPGC